MTRRGIASLERAAGHWFLAGLRWRRLRLGLAVANLQKWLWVAALEALEVVGLRPRRAVDLRIKPFSPIRTSTQD
jgi:hypothetical protein